MEDRLPSGIEATGLVRQVQSQGDFAAILQRGDPDRGALLLVVRSRDRHVACLERALSPSGSYAWAAVGPEESSSAADVAEFLQKRTRFDSDCWIIELDIARPERFIAETTSSG